MKLFKKKGVGKKKWRAKGRLIDLHKTKVTIIVTDTTKPERHMPPWVYKRIIEGLSNSDAQEIATPPESSEMLSQRLEML